MRREAGVSKEDMLLKLQYLVANFYDLQFPASIVLWGNVTPLKMPEFVMFIK